MHLLAIMQNFKIKSSEWIQSYDNMPFSGQNDLIAPNENYFQENH